MAGAAKGEKAAPCSAGSRFGWARSRVTWWQRARVWVLAGCVALIVAGVHWPVLSAQALCFDDHQYVTQNPLVQDPGWASAHRFLVEVLEPSTVAGYYQPLSMISLMLDYAAGGRAHNLWPFHRTSLILHVANTVLVLVLLHLLFGRIWLATGAALLFGLHPMTVETVAWVAERKTVLSTFFGLWCLILYVSYTRGPRWWCYVAGILAYGLALLSKPTVTPLPLLMLVLDYWPLRRWSRRAVLEKVPYVAVGAVAALVTVISQGRAAAVELPSGHSIGRLVLTICYDIAFYLHKIVWPSGLSPHYAVPEPLTLSNPTVLLGVVCTSVLVVLLVVSARWTRAGVSGGLFFLLALAPTLGIIGFTVVIASDKYIYLPSVGLLVMVVAFLRAICDGGKVIGSAQRKVVVFVVLVSVACAEAAVTRKYLARWRNTVRLHEHMLAVAPRSPQVHVNLGIALASQGDLDGAIRHFRSALEAKPAYAKAYANLGRALVLKGEPREAIRAYRRLLELEPDFAEGHYYLGQLLYAQGEEDEGITHLRRSLELHPGYVDALYALAIIHERRQEFEAAVRCLRDVVSRAPDHAEAQDHLGLALYALGRSELACEHFERAMMLRPDWAEPVNSLAWILATHPSARVRAPADAVRLAERACAITRHQDAACLDTLAAAYASAGEFERATETATAALKLAVDADLRDLADAIRSRLASYEQGQPYRDEKPAQTGP